MKIKIKNKYTYINHDMKVLYSNLIVLSLLKFLQDNMKLVDFEMGQVLYYHMHKGKQLVLQ